MVLVFIVYTLFQEYHDPYEQQRKEREIQFLLEPSSPLMSELKMASTKRAIQAVSIHPSLCFLLYQYSSLFLR